MVSFKEESFYNYSDYYNMYYLLHKRQLAARIKHGPDEEIHRKSDKRISAAR